MRPTWPVHTAWGQSFSPPLSSSSFFNLKNQTPKQQSPTIWKNGPHPMSGSGTFLWPFTGRALIPRNKSWVPSLGLEDGGRPIHLPSWRLHVGKAAGAGWGLGTPVVVTLPKPGSGLPGSQQKRWGPAGGRLGPSATGTHSVPG